MHQQKVYFFYCFSFIFLPFVKPTFAKAWLNSFHNLGLFNSSNTVQEWLLHPPRKKVIVFCIARDEIYTTMKTKQKTLYRWASLFTVDKSRYFEPRILNLEIKIHILKFGLFDEFFKCEQANSQLKRPRTTRSTCI
jgi:hypothetical protein